MRNIANPLPLSCLVLLAFLPGVLLFGIMLARTITRDRRVAGTLAPGLALAAWLTAVHANARMTESFLLGLWAGTLSVAFGGAVLFLWARRRPSIEAHPSDAPAFEHTPMLQLSIAAAVATVLFLPAALGWSFHDEVFITGHMSMTAEIQNDIYPPRHLTFAAFELRYHYGFALLCAMASALFRLRVDRAIDLVTIAGWTYSVFLFTALGDRLLERRRGLLTAACVLFGAGFPFALGCLPSLLDGNGACAPLDVAALSLVAPGDIPMNPPVVSYFFQHPWSLGIPLSAVLLLLAEEDEAPSPLLRSSAMALVLVALSFSQFVLFCALCPVLLIGDLSKRPRDFQPVVAIAVAWIAARALGGLFAPAAEAGPAFSWNAAIVERPLAVIAWNAHNFGFLLPLGVAGLFLRRRARFLYLALFLGGFLAVNLLEYGYSWDIVKFATVASLGLSVPASAAVSWLLDLKPRLGGRMAAAVALILSTVAGFTFLGSFWMKTPAAMLHVHETPSAPDEDASAISWLRRRISAGEIVYCRIRLAPSCATWGGLPQLWPDMYTGTLGFSDERIARRRALAETLPPDPQIYARENVRWFILDPGDQRLVALVEPWLMAKTATVAARFGDVRVVELLR